VERRRQRQMCIRDRYVTNQTANTVSVVNVTNHTVTKTISVGKKPNGIVIKM
jgi:YVTN family beta-propeller protein